MSFNPQGTSSREGTIYSQGGPLHTFGAKLSIGKSQNPSAGVQDIEQVAGIQIRQLTGVGSFDVSSSFAREDSIDENLASAIIPNRNQSYNPKPLIKVTTKEFKEDPNDSKEDKERNRSSMNFTV